MDVTRRTLLASAGAVSLATLLAGCCGFTGQGDSTSSNSGTKTLFLVFQRSFVQGVARSGIR
jgi:hypothetical protein